MSTRRTQLEGNRRSNTKPELALRSALHALGLRYRVDYRIGTERGSPRPDIAFLGPRVAVFVDGCFWHSCPLHQRLPQNNAGFWLAKLARNVERDRQNDATLRGMGWALVRVWEHDDPAEAADRIRNVVISRSAGR